MIDMNEPNRPAWREPMVWLMLGLPAACLVAIAVTLTTAVDFDATTSSPDAVTRTAQVQNTDLAADHRASAMGLQATLSRDEDRVSLQLQLPDPVPTRLRLLATHPTRAAADVMIWLQRQTDGSWQAERASQEAIEAWPGAASAWSLSLSPEDASWRIDANLPAGSTEALLMPRFGPPSIDPPSTDHE